MLLPRTVLLGIPERFRVLDTKYSIQNLPDWPTSSPGSYWTLEVRVCIGSVLKDLKMLPVCSVVPVYLWPSFFCPQTHEQYTPPPVKSYETKKKNQTVPQQKKKKIVQLKSLFVKPFGDLVLFPCTQRFNRVVLSF